MKSIILEIKNNVVKNQVVFIGGVVTFVIGLLLGLFLPSIEKVNLVFSDLVFNYYQNIFNLDSTISSIFLNSLLNAFLIMFLASILCLSIYSFFVNYIIILSKGD